MIAFRGEPARLSSMVRTWSDVRDSQDALLLPILLQAGTDAEVS